MLVVRHVIERHGVACGGRLFASALRYLPRKEADLPLQRRLTPLRHAILGGMSLLIDDLIHTTFTDHYVTFTGLPCIRSRYGHDRVPVPQS